MLYDKPSLSDIEDLDSIEADHSDDSGKFSLCDQKGHEVVPYKEAIENRTLSRDQLINLMHFPNFDEAVMGKLVRLE